VLSCYYSSSQPVKHSFVVNDSYIARPARAPTTPSRIDSRRSNCHLLRRDEGHTNPPRSHTCAGHMPSASNARAMTSGA
jgi:hypothetical protein